MIAGKGSFVASIRIVLHGQSLRSKGNSAEQIFGCLNNLSAHRSNKMNAKYGNGNTIEKNCRRRFLNVPFAP